jgi:hypothetical protein
MAVAGGAKWYDESFGPALPNEVTSGSFGIRPPGKMALVRSRTVS